MGWEQGPRGRPYYTRTLRVGGRRVRQYLGSGERGRAAAAADALKRAQRRARADARRQEQARLREVDGLVLRLFELVCLVADTALVAGGYHRHGGEWRSRYGRHDGREAL